MDGPTGIRSHILRKGREVASPTYLAIPLCQEKQTLFKKLPLPQPQQACVFISLARTDHVSVLSCKGGWKGGARKTLTGQENQ